MPIGADNQSALALIRNPISSQRSKHIEVAHHFVRERAQRGDVMFIYVPTDKMAADFLTKIVPAEKHAFCRTRLGLRE